VEVNDVDTVPIQRQTDGLSRLKLRSRLNAIQIIAECRYGH
jgi:hypothetical protein